MTSGTITIGATGAAQTGDIIIGAGLTSGNLTLGGTGAQTGSINIGTGTGNQTINLGTGSGAKTIKIGTGNTSTTVQIGPSGSTFNNLGTCTFTATLTTTASNRT